VPRHVAFVMDGNRRFARERGWVVRRGHEEGFESLKSVRGIPRLDLSCFCGAYLFVGRGKTLSLCVGLRIRYITVYAFSIDNFARPKDEVEGLLELTRGRLRRLCEAGYVFPLSLTSAPSISLHQIASLLKYHGGIANSFVSA
jgi:ditrans,polycis-polyprenyl diphosphate synthase